MEFRVRYLTLFCLFSVIDSFEWFWMGSFHKNNQLMLEFLKAPFLVLRFSYYTLMTLMILPVILKSILMIFNGSVLDEKLSFKMLGLYFSSKLNWSIYIISIIKTASKKNGILIRFMKFLSPKVALRVYKSMWSCWHWCFQLLFGNNR